MSFEIKNFPLIAIGSLFTVDGETFRKTSDLIFTDVAGIERYIDPLFDKKLTPKPAPAPVAVVAGVNPSDNVAPIQVNNDGHVVLSDTDVDRIARRVAEILKGQ